ncbi:MAG: hypothetical protein Q8K64_14900 [Sediminibacterium sp.]|nr:hypothetical protein [Sediminibacterium sp.]
MLSIPRKRFTLVMAIFCIFCRTSLAVAQNYHAIHGSPYAGAAGIFNNPASPVTSLHKWNLNLFAFQAGISTNMLTVQNLKIPSFSNTTIQFTQGAQNRWAHQVLDLNLFNAMYQLNKKHAISAGLRIRTYNHVHGGSFNMNDSITSIKDFLILNRATPFLQGNTIHSAWLEGNLNYSTVLKENENGKLTGGITLQIMKNVSGAYIKVNKVSYLETIYPSDTLYSFTEGFGSFAYSANYDATSNTINTQGNIKAVLNNSLSSLGLSLGMEYLVYDKDAVVGEGAPIPYKWKLGVSIMDIGSHPYKTSKFTGQFSNPNTLLTNRDVADKLVNIASARDLRDSLATLFNSNTTLPEKFNIANPTRIILNVDRNLGNDFYLNAQLNLNLRGTRTFAKLNSREINLITITPRWETAYWGFYLPIQYNTQGQFWMGTAIKAGPLVAGIHNIGLFKKETQLNGGGYLMLSIYPFQKRNYASRLDCATE